MAEWYKLDIKEVAEIQGISPEAGLSLDEVALRQKKYGPNELKEKKRRPIILSFLDQFKNVLIIILLIASGFAFLIGESKDSIAILAIVVINSIIGVSQEIRAEREIEKLKKLVVPLTTALREGKPERIFSKELVPGDIVFLETGSFIPADLRVIEAHNLRIDESTLTGESIPVEKNTEKILEKLPISDQTNMAFMGTTVVYGRGKALVVETGMRSELGKIAELIETGKKEETPLEKRFKEIGRVLAAIAIVICFTIFIAGIFRGEKLINMILTSVSLAVAAVPESLPAVITIVLSLGAYRMAKRNAIVRKLPAVETLGSITAICSDKTGTLTQNKMVVENIYVPNKLYKISGMGYEPKGDFTYEGKKIDPLEIEDLKTTLIAAALCNDAYIKYDGKEWKVIGDTTEGALLTSSLKAGLNKEEIEKEYPRLKEIPFNSKRKRMTTIHKIKDGEFIAFIKGALDDILMLSNTYGTLSKELPYSERQRILKLSKDQAGGGMRVLGFAYIKLPELPTLLKPEEIERDLTFLGFASMADPPRPEVKESIEICKKAGIKPVMVTGDHKLTGLAIGRELSLARDERDIITGIDLEALSEDDLLQRINDTKIFARVSPEHKIRIIETLWKKGHIVAMTGDGVNDAPALKRADIGVAMGISGTDVAKEAGDIVLADDNFATIVAAIEEGRRIYDNIKKFIRYMISTNSGEVFTMFFSIILGLPLPLLPLQILWVNLVTDSFPALALGIEEKEKDIMLRPPRKPKETIFDRNMIISILGIGILMTISTLSIFKIGLIQGSLLKARTMAFSVLALLQMAHVLNCRSEKVSIFRLGLFSNIYLTLAIALTFILQGLLIYVPFLNNIFKTAPLSGLEIFMVISFSITPIIVVEIRKLISKIGLLK